MDERYESFEDQTGTRESDPELNEKIRGMLSLEKPASCIEESGDNGYYEYIIDRWGYDVVRAHTLVDRYFHNRDMTCREFDSLLSRIAESGLQLKPFKKMRKDELRKYYWEIVRKIRADYNIDSGPLPRTPWEILLETERFS